MPRNRIIDPFTLTTSPSMALPDPFISVSAIPAARDAVIAWKIATPRAMAVMRPQIILRLYWRPVKGALTTAGAARRIRDASCMGTIQALPKALPGVSR